MDPNDERVDEVFGTAAESVRRAVDRLDVRLPEAAELRVRARRRATRNLSVIGAVAVLVLGLGVAFGPGGSASRLAVEPPGTAVGPPATPDPSTGTTEWTPAGTGVPAPAPGAPTVVEPTTTTSTTVPGTHDGLLSTSMRIDVDPASALGNQAKLTVQGSGFPSGQSVTVLMCTSDAANQPTIAVAQGFCDINAQEMVRSRDDGTFVTRFEVRRSLATMGGTFDCAQGNIDPGRFIERRDRGDAGLFTEPGAWGCAIVAVVFRNDPMPDGGATLVPTEAAAFPVLIDPASTTTRHGDPRPVVVGGCTTVEYSDGTPYAQGQTGGSAYAVVSFLALELSQQPLSAPPCDARVKVIEHAGGTYEVPLVGNDSYVDLLEPG